MYLNAGADFIETNTFSGTSIAQTDYGCQHLVSIINIQAAKIAKAACQDVAKETGFFWLFFLAFFDDLFYRSTKICLWCIRSNK
jgi:hypothetical protein